MHSISYHIIYQYLWLHLLFRSYMLCCELIHHQIHIWMAPDIKSIQHIMMWNIKQNWRHIWRFLPLICKIILWNSCCFLHIQCISVLDLWLHRSHKSLNKNIIKEGNTFLSGYCIVSTIHIHPSTYLFSPNGKHLTRNLTLRWMGLDVAFARMECDVIWSWSGEEIARSLTSFTYFCCLFVPSNRLDSALLHLTWRFLSFDFGSCRCVIDMGWLVVWGRVIV